MSITVRTITDDELASWVRVNMTGFNMPTSDELIQWRRETADLTRCHGGFDGDEVVGSARAFDTPLTLPGGGTISAGAVTSVAVSPTARRRGVLTALMAAQLDDIAARGELVAVLIAAEAPIYGRFGYGAATERIGYTLDTNRARFAGRPAAADQLALVDNETIRVLGPPIYERYRAAQPGAIGRDDLWWDRFTGVRRFPKDEDPDKRFHVICGADGWLSYIVEEKWDPNGAPNSKAVVHELVAVTPEAYAALWWYVLELDWIGTVEVGERPTVEALPALLTDSRHVVRSETWDFLWVRLLDVVAGLEARTYFARERLVLDVVDAFRPQSAGRYVLDTTAPRPVCVRTDEPADLTLDVGEVGAAYLGRALLHVAAWAGGVVEHTPGAIARFDHLFHHTPQPWCNTWF